jgi:hypothetical protein
VRNASTLWPHCSQVRRLTNEAIGTLAESPFRARSRSLSTPRCRQCKHSTQITPVVRALDCRLRLASWQTRNATATRDIRFKWLCRPAFWSPAGKANPIRIRSASRKPSRTSCPVHGLSYLVGTFRRQRLIANELVLHLSTFVRSVHLPLKLIIRATRTATHVRHDGEQHQDSAGQA